MVKGVQGDLTVIMISFENWDEYFERLKARHENAYDLGRGVGSDAGSKAHDYTSEAKPVGVGVGFRNDIKTNPKHRRTMTENQCMIHIKDEKETTNRHARTPNRSSHNLRD